MRGEVFLQPAEGLQVRRGRTLRRFVQGAGELRGLLLEQLGRLEDARTSYEAALKQNPEDTGVSQLLAALNTTGPTAEPIATVPDGGGN